MSCSGRATLSAALTGPLQGFALKASGSWRSERRRNRPAICRYIRRALESACDGVGKGCADLRAGRRGERADDDATGVEGEHRALALVAATCSRLGLADAAGRRRQDSQDEAQRRQGRIRGFERVSRSLRRGSTRRNVAGEAPSSLRAERSNPRSKNGGGWIASSPRNKSGGRFSR